MLAFIILTDASSIIENLHQLGFEVPYFLVRYLGIARDRLDTKMGEMLDVKPMSAQELPDTIPVPVEEAKEPTI